MVVIVVPGEGQVSVQSKCARCLGMFQSIYHLITVNAWGYLRVEVAYDKLTPSSVPSSVFLADVDPCDPPCPPLPFPGRAILVGFFLSGVAEDPWDKNHLVVRAHGGLMVSDQLDHAHASLGFSKGWGGIRAARFQGGVSFLG